MSELTNEETEEPATVGLRGFALEEPSTVVGHRGFALEEPSTVVGLRGFASEETDNSIQEVQEINGATEIQSHVVQKTSKWMDYFRNLFSSSKGSNQQKQVATAKTIVTDGTTNSAAGQQSDYSALSGVINNKKTLANGLVDFALLTANANQLHNAIKSTYEGSEKTVSVALISMSMGLQLVTGVLLIVGSYIQSKMIPVKNAEQPNSGPANVYNQKRLDWLSKIDHLTLTLVFLIAIMNVFIAAFATPQAATQTPTG